MSTEVLLWSERRKKTECNRLTQGQLGTAVVVVVVVVVAVLWLVSALD